MSSFYLKGIIRCRVASVGDFEPDVPGSIPSQCSGHGEVSLGKPHFLAWYCFLLHRDHE